MAVNRLSLTDKAKENLIDALTPELAALRAKADISQSELANLIGVSRQTYGSIERQDRRMTWGTYLSLILYYDYNPKTRQMLRATGAFPSELFPEEGSHGTISAQALHGILDSNMLSMLDALDEQAFRTIQTMIMLEYARCTQLPGEVVVKSFNGKTYDRTPTPSVKAQQALKSIREQRSHDK